MKDGIKKRLREMSESMQKDTETLPTGMQTAGWFPEEAEVKTFLEHLRIAVFPGYFERTDRQEICTEKSDGGLLFVIYHELYHLLEKVVRLSTNAEMEGKTDETLSAHTLRFLSALPEIRRLLETDVEATLNGDPAAESKEEIIHAYPGIFAIFVYRAAHELYRMQIPLLPRIMAEQAHSRTGIDIHPGAEIGDHFFIDHGTGIVIGETTVIGSHVRIYQGVTLGALSTMKGRLLSGTKRHPTIEDGVVIYANATILGGNTVIGSNSVIAGNTFVTEPVPENSKVYALMPPLAVEKRIRRQVNRLK